MSVTAISKAKPADTPALLRQALDEIGTEFFERREDAEGLMVTILASGNAYLLGERGIAKSALCRRIASVFDGAIFFERLLHRQLPLEELFGQIDMPLYEKTGLWQRRPNGKMQAAHFDFLDETGKAGPSVLNPILTIAIDKLYEDQETGQMVSTPTISVFGASNEVLEDELSAAWDRFDWRKKLKAIQEPENFLALLDTDGATAPSHTTIPLSALLAAQEEVKAVTVPQAIKEKMLGLKASLAAQGIVPTDRRWKRSVRFLKAMAYLHGRSTVDDDDLQILVHMLWETDAQITPVENTVLQVVSEFAKQAVSMQTWVTQVHETMDSLKGASAKDRGMAAADMQVEVKRQVVELRKLIKKADDEGRSTAKLKTVAELINALRIRIQVEMLGMTEEKAVKLIAIEDE